MEEKNISSVFLSYLGLNIIKKTKKILILSFILKLQHVSNLAQSAQQL
jgi:hypothetical protein